MMLSQIEIVEYVCCNPLSTDSQVASILGYSRSYVTATLNKFLSKYMTAEEISERKRNNYRISKLGKKNPMAGKYGKAHHYYKGVISDGKGYELVLKPAWYTERRGSKHVFYHHVVYCIDRGLLGIPRGWCIHHIDNDKTNNVPTNLIMLSVKDHMRLHQRQKNLQNVSRKDDD